jgi:hypothetical protein
MCKSSGNSWLLLSCCCYKARNYIAMVFIQILLISARWRFKVRFKVRWTSPGQKLSPTILTLVLTLLVFSIAIISLRTIRLI